MGRLFLKKFSSIGCERRGRLLAWAVVLLLVTGFVRAQTPGGEPRSFISTPSASNTLRCSPGSVTFAATGCTTGSTPKWYESSALNKELGSGITFTTPSLEKTTDYYLACVSDDNDSFKSPAVRVTAIISPKLVVTISGVDSLCEKSSRVYWGSPTGGTFSLPESLDSAYFTVYGGNNLLLLPTSGIPTISVDYVYTDPATGCSAKANRIITSIPSPTPSVNNPTICEGDTATLTIKNCAGSIGWFGGGIYGDSKIMRVSPTVTTDYFAYCFRGGCDSLVNARVTVIPRQPALISGPDAICTSQLPFSFVGTPAGGDFILPKGLPSGAVIVNKDQLTVNPGFEIANMAFRYQKNYISDECGAVLTANKYLTISPSIKPTVTKPLTICAGASVNLSIDNCPGKIHWRSNGFQPISNDTDRTVTVFPNVTTDYFVQCIVGGCDTTLATKVLIDGINPGIIFENSYCSADSNTGNVTVIITEGATLTANIGTMIGNKIYDIPDYKTLTVTSSLNGCTTQRSLKFTCGANPFPYPRCYYNRIDTIAATAAICTGSLLNNDASIWIDGVNANRYTYAKTYDGLLPYDDASKVVNYKIAISDLPNPTIPAGQIYYVRLYDRSDSCSFDTTVVVPYRDCRIPCTKPDAGEDYFSTGVWSTVQLPKAGPLQKWRADPGNPYGTINAATGLVNGIQAGKYSFILSDSGPGGPCADTVVVYSGIQELPTITTYSDTVTLPKYLINQWDGKILTNVYGIWVPLPGNPATLTYSGKVSGLTAPGEYKFVLNIPFDKNYPSGQFSTLTLTVIKLEKPDDCPPQLCLPFSIKRTKLAEK